jgi:hypothetical protein
VLRWILRMLGRRCEQNFDVLISAAIVQFPHCYPGETFIRRPMYQQVFILVLRDRQTGFSLGLKWNTIIALVSVNCGRLYWEKDKHTECVITNDMVWWEAFIWGLRKRHYHQWSLQHQYSTTGEGMFYRRRQAREDKRRVTKAVRRERGGGGYYL